ncbi:MAG: hypothetical protein GXO21_06035 [Aquificae bacterium]|nr:hypothetical protein [Aquificota bacterium]
MKNKEEKTKLELTLTEILLKGQLEELKEVLKSLYATVPYHLFVRKDIREGENYYAVGIEIDKENKTVKNVLWEKIK